MGEAELIKRVGNGKIQVIFKDNASFMGKVKGVIGQAWLELVPFDDTELSKRYPERNIISIYSPVIREISDIKAISILEEPNTNDERTDNEDGKSE